MSPAVLHDAQRIAEGIFFACVAIEVACRALGIPVPQRFLVPSGAAKRDRTKTALLCVAALGMGAWTAFMLTRSH